MKVIVRTNVQPGIGTFINTYIPSTDNDYLTDVDYTETMKQLWQEDYNLLTDEIQEDSFFGEETAQIVTRGSAIYYEISDVQTVDTRKEEADK